MKEGLKKEGKKHCLFCSNKIDLKKDNFVLVGTYNRVSKPNDEQYFHFLCWVDYFNQCVLNTARANVKFMQGKAMQLFNSPVMKSLLSQIQGSEQVLNMLQIPLEEKTSTNFIKKISDKIQNVRKRKTKRKSRKKQ